MIDPGRLRDAISFFKDSRLLVVGDIMLDEFVWGEVSRISPEAPVPVVEVQQETMLLGGAANVANNLRALGGEVILAGVVGDDSVGQALKDLAAALGIDTAAVVTSSRPTTLKTRIVARGQQVVRVDREKKGAVETAAVETLLRIFQAALPPVDGIVVSDYAKGVVSAPVMDCLRTIAREHGLPLLVDPKPAGAPLYHGAAVVTPNEREAEAMSGIAITGLETLRQAAERLQDLLGTESVLVTRGPAGMALWQREAGLFSIPTMAREVFDVTGAGDTVIATFALGIVNRLSPQEAACLANLAAGVVVGKIGTATVSGSELADLVRTCAPGCSNSASIEPAAGRFGPF